MTKLPSASVATTTTTTTNAVIFSVTVILISLSLPSPTHALGSGSTLAVAYGTATVCAVVAAQSTQRILCYQRGTVVALEPNISFSSISAGQNFLCGIRAGGSSLLCWDTQINTITNFSNNLNFVPKRIYYNDTALLSNIAVGNDHVCATTVQGQIHCWRGNVNNSNVPSNELKFESLTSGFDFSCGILINNNNTVRCWGINSMMANEIERSFANRSMLSITAGGNQVCGIDSNGFVTCYGDNESGQLNIQINSTAFEYSALALGFNHSCAIRRLNGSVVCWGGGGGDYSANGIRGVSFESIVSGSNFTCGLVTSDFSVICWGPGWPNEWKNHSVSLVPFRQEILPGPCVNSSCGECGLYPQSDILCSGDGGNICKSCLSQSIVPTRPMPPPDSHRSSSPSRELTTGLLVFAIVGSVGAFASICTIIYWLWTGACFGKKKVHNSVQPTITRGGSGGGSNGGGAGSNSSPLTRSATVRRQGSRLLAMKRQRSGTSSKHADRAEEFTVAELAAATDNFSLENKIGAGSFGVVYKGKLSDGREVAIKRGETSQKTKKFQEKESAFESELAFLSRLHHKHLVGLVGYCEERDERLLVYEYMKNGALYDHLHDRNNVEKNSSVINSWKMRIKIALDAGRGIEYLHNYAVPPIIHRDIKSSNILLDAQWTARVSDFGLSLMGPESSERDFRPTKAAGTVGYIDPEYYGLNVLTAKSDVYGLGVVLLELLTGKRAIFKNDENGGTPVSIVDFAVPVIMAGELVKILDRRVGPPEINEAEAVELVAYTAMHCVNLEGKERPTMADIVANLERALDISDHSHGSISSSGILSIGSD